MARRPHFGPCDQINVNSISKNKSEAIVLSSWDNSQPHIHNIHVYIHIQKKRKLPIFHCFNQSQGTNKRIYIHLKIRLQAYLWLQNSLVLSSLNINIRLFGPSKSLRGSILKICLGGVICSVCYMMCVVPWQEQFIIKL